MTDILLSVPSDDPKLPSWVEVPAAQVTGIPDSPDDIGAATAEQGARADSAVQPTDLPAFGTAATTDADDYATAEQGALADATKVQQVTLTAPLAYTLPVGTPANTVHRVMFTQDATGGHTVTYGPDPVTVDTTAGASTLVEIWPGGRVQSAADAARAVDRARVAPSLDVIQPWVMHDKLVLAQVGDTLYAKATVGVPPVLYVSIDRGLTWTSRGALPALVDILYHVKMTGTLIIIEGETVSTPPLTPGLPRVWRSTNDGASWTLIPDVLTVPPLGSSGISEGTGGEIMIAEYAALRPWVYRVRRSIDDGLTWTTAFSSDGRDPGAGDNGHIHSLTYDPVAGRHNVFLDYSIVDGVDGPQIWTTADNGANWTLVGKSTSVDHPNFVTPMYFDRYIAWGSDNQINGRISRLSRADFYAGNFGATEHVQQLSEKAIYGAMPIRQSADGGATVYLVAVNGEHIVSGEQDGLYSTMTEVFVVSNEGLTVSGGVSTYRANVAPGALTGVRAQFPTRHFDTFDTSGLAWVNFPHGAPRPSYMAVPITQGWGPATQQAVTSATPVMKPGAPFSVQYATNPASYYHLMMLSGDAGQVSIGNHSVSAAARSVIEVKPDGVIDFRSNGALAAQLTGGRLLAYGRIDTAASGVGLRGGISAPEGSVTAMAGSLYQMASGDLLYYKATGTGNTGWRRLIPPAVTTADLSNVTHAVNTTAKWLGMQAFDTTAGRPVWSSGTEASAVWKYADGTTAATPV